ncbi:MAG TPA: glycosyltransferase [Thermoleophilaceae bacterium]|nr:glycosyltransferase [Thermoleophilaceae bacterium]
MTAVHQVLSSAGPYDAVSVQARLWRSLLTERGYGGADHAAAVDPRARGDFAPLERLRPARGDLLVIRWSAYSPRLLRLLERLERKLLVYHNVTPPGYFWNHHPGVAVACAVGRAQLPLFARAADVCAADSEFNAGDLRAAGVADARVLPILFDPARLAERGRAPGGEGPLVLVVSRLAPNKRHDLAIAAFDAWRAEHGGPARMLCVGEPLSPSYAALIGGLANGTVTLAGGLSQPDLNAAYEDADVMLSMSEHEGFSVPLLEAFHFGLPVVARPAGAMPEVGGDAVLWDRADDLAVTAELIDAAVNDDGLRATLAGRGRARLAEYEHAHTAERIEAAIKDALA